MVKQFPVLITERLILRQLIVDDGPLISILRSDENVNKYISRPPETTMEETAVFIENINNGLRNGENHYWGMCDSMTKELCGTFPKNLKVLNWAMNLCRVIRAEG